MNRDNKIIFLTCLFSTISFFLVDFYLPSLPILKNYLHASSSNIKLIISYYLLGLGLSQLVYGVLSDKYGRKLTLLCGMIICFFANLLAIYATNINEMLLLRFIAGLGAGACPAITRAILRDSFDGSRLLKANSYLSMSITLSPALAPLLGGLIQQYYNWQFNFVFISLWCLLSIFLVCFVFKETFPKKDRIMLNLSTIKNNFYVMIVDRVFISATTISLFSISACLSYYTITPFIFQNKLYLSPGFNGAIYFFNALANLAGALYVNYHSKKMLSEKLLERGVIISLIGSSLMLLSCLFGMLNLYTIIIPMLFVNFAFGLIMPTTGTIALREFKSIGGSSAALMGFIRMGGSGIVVSIVSYMRFNTAVFLSTVLFILFFVNLFIFKMGFVPSKNNLAKNPEH